MRSFTTTGPASVAALSAQSTSQLEPADFARSPNRQESAHWITRTALCVEVRDPRRANGPKAEAVGKKSGVMYVFMPPLERLEHYLDLLAAIEATAQDMGVQIVIEGYPPPRTCATACGSSGGALATAAKAVRPGWLTPHTLRDQKAALAAANANTTNVAMRTGHTRLRFVCMARL